MMRLLLLYTWLEFANLALIVYAFAITVLFAYLRCKKQPYLQQPSPTLERLSRPYFSLRTVSEIQGTAHQKQVKLNLTITNIGKEEALDVKVNWYDETDANWPEVWKANSSLTFEHPLKVGNMHRGQDFQLELACETENVVDQQGRDVFFYYFELELEFKLSDGETYYQVLRSLNFSDEFEFEHSGHVSRYFE